MDFDVDEDEVNRTDAYRVKLPEHFPQIYTPCRIGHKAWANLIIYILDASFLFTYFIHCNTTPQ